MKLDKPTDTNFLGKMKEDCYWNFSHYIVSARAQWKNILIWKNSTKIQYKCANYSNMNHVCNKLKSYLI